MLRGEVLQGIDEFLVLGLSSVSHYLDLVVDCLGYSVVYDRGIVFSVFLDLVV